MQNWFLKTFKELSNLELYGILRLRSAVFVVDQNCIFEDMDGKDYESCLHLFCKIEDEVVACARLFPAGITYEEASIGRVCTSTKHRGLGLGKELMQRACNQMEILYPKQSIRIGAQCYLTKFYNSFGFKEVGKIYLEDGINHIHMLRG